MNINEWYTKRRRIISDKVLKPFAELLFKLKIKPNTVSLITALALLISSYLINIRFFNYAIILIIISVLTDLLDGAVARKYKFDKYGFIVDNFVDYCFGALLIIAIYTINFIGFNLMLATVASTLLYNILYVYYKLKTSKTPFTIPLGISYITIIILLMPWTSNFLITTVLAAQLLQSALLFTRV
ncbi:MAG: CDP-alcohol phosphatidyltransferase family protein [Nanoarchaeota archaeon]|nr:CDP-alcohol phosphatidyltransferase family protein [Nanoarchaeota archaeon]